MGCAYKYAEENLMETVQDYPLNLSPAATQTCKYDASKGKFKISSSAGVKKDSNLALKEALQEGPVVIAMNGASMAVQTYQGGIIQNQCDGKYPDHGALAVGYGVEDGVKYIIIKNTWGVDWGENGYLRVQDVDGFGMCGVNRRASYPII